MARSLNERQLLLLIDALASGSWISRAALAEICAISEQSVASHLNNLRGWQLEVETRSGKLCRLVHPPRRLDAKKIKEHLPPAWRDRIRVRVQPIVDSTNTRLLALPSKYDPQALFAEYQSAGRGRQGRRWISPFGSGMWLSLAWLFEHCPSHVGTLSLAVGVCCARVLRSIGLADVMLKWPNDLWLMGAKLGGILIERNDDSSACRFVIGIGINVSMNANQACGLDRPWTTLQQGLLSVQSALPERNVLASQLLTSLADGLECFSLSGFASFAHDWDMLDITRNRSVTVNGSRSLNGISRGIDLNGALRIETDAGIALAYSGDVSLSVCRK